MPTQGRISASRPSAILRAMCGIGHVRAGHADHVELAARNRVARGGDVLDAGGVKGRQAGLGAHFAGEIKVRGRALAHARDDAAQRLVAVDMAADHVEKVDQPRTGQAARDRHALVAAQAPIPILVADEPRADEEIGTDAPPHRLEHRHAEAQAVVDRPAIFVGAPVGGRRPELVDQMAVALEFDAIEPAGLHPLGRVGVSGDHAGDVPVLHRLGEGAMGGLAHMRGRDHRQPIVLAPAGAAPEMGDLDHHRGALVVHVVGELLEPPHAFVLVKEDVAERLRTVGRDHRRTADHGQRDAALRFFGMVEPIAGLRHAVVGVGRLMRGRHQPVAQGEPAQLEGLQQRIDGHRAASTLRRTIGSARRGVNPGRSRRAAPGCRAHRGEGV